MIGLKWPHGYIRRVWAATHANGLDELVATSRSEGRRANDAPAVPFHYAKMLHDGIERSRGWTKE